MENKQISVELSRTYEYRTYGLRDKFALLPIASYDYDYYGAPKKRKPLSLKQRSKRRKATKQVKKSRKKNR